MRIAMNAADVLDLEQRRAGYCRQLAMQLVTSSTEDEFLFTGHAGWRLPFQLRKEKPAVYIGLDGEGSAAGTVPQVLIVGGTTPPASILNKLMFPGILRRAAAIVTPSYYNRQQLAEKYRLDAAKIVVIPPVPAAAFAPVSWEQREKIKNQYTGGNEFFFFSGTLHPSRNIGVLLRAFSVFKKWQKSNMKLLIAGELPPRHEKELDDLDNYRYRSDLVMPGELTEQERADVLAAAYAVVYPAACSFSGYPVITAMAAEVPVITTAGSALEEAGGEAVLYTASDDSRQMGEQMIRLYKDEALRMRLVAAGKARAIAYNSGNQFRNLNQLLRSAGSV